MLTNTGIKINIKTGYYPRNESITLVRFWLKVEIIYCTNCFVTNRKKFPQIIILNRQSPWGHKRVKLLIRLLS